MSGISPDSNIKIYKNVPLDNTYNHTLYFANVSAQNDYFHGVASVQHSLTAQSYQRVRKGAMRIAVNAENLYTCNYLAFQNHAYGTKWFYAFITSVEYVNDTTSEVTFEIDVMQTYLFDVTLKQCFVEREHSETDELFGNIQPEPVSLGEYIDSTTDSIMSNDSPFVIVVKTADGQHSGNVYDNVFSGCQLMIFNSTDGAGIVNFINQYVSQPDEITNIYMLPAQLYQHPVQNGGQPLGGNEVATSQIKPLITCNGTETFDGYTPRNKKLYTYPYNFVRIDNNSGQSLNLRYEFGNNGTIWCELSGTLMSPVKVILRPTNYKNRSNPSKSESLTLDSFPICSWNVDAYKQWLAQNSIPVALQSVAGVGTSAIAAAFSVHPIGALATGIIGTVAHVLSQNYEASIAADQCRGNTANGNANFAHGVMNFYYTRTHITKEYARVIDDFFTMFGYATNRVKCPNRSARSRWNYTKTVGCVVVGNAPAEDVKTICQIYDNGITFWKNASEVGNYSLSNDVPTP